MRGFCRSHRSGTGLEPRGEDGMKTLCGRLASGMVASGDPACRCCDRVTNTRTRATPRRPTPSSRRSRTFTKYLDPTASDSQDETLTRTRSTSRYRFHYLKRPYEVGAARRKRSHRRPTTTTGAELPAMAGRRHRRVGLRTSGSERDSLCAASCLCEGRAGQYAITRSRAELFPRDKRTPFRLRAPGTRG